MTQNNELYQPLFMSDADWQNNACLNFTPDSLELFIMGYKAAADDLVSSIMEQRKDQDILIFPIVFLYRQHIELRFKEIIREGGLLLLEDRDFPKTHSLVRLWPMVKRIIEKLWPNDKLKEIGLIQHVVSEFNIYDPESMSFRYPEDKNGNNPLASVSHINLRHLATIIEDVSNFLFGVSAAISEYRHAEYELQMNSY